MTLLNKYFAFFCLISLFANVFAFSNDSVVEVDSRSKILSRRKRFLIFPEGSSFQLVFCVTHALIVQSGDIFFFGTTAALAWELPQDPYSPFMHHADPLHRRVDSKNLLYTDEYGKVLFTRPYKKKHIVNPAFAKRSVNEAYSVNESKFKKGTPNFKIDRKQMHVSQQRREYLKSEHMDERSAEFHRNSRHSLYEKIEVLLKSLGTDGRKCLLKTLCQVGQTKTQQQGAFFQEILRAVFTIPKRNNSEEDYYQDYYNAHFATQPCEKLYPECTEPMQEPMIA